MSSTAVSDPLTLERISEPTLDGCPPTTKFGPSFLSFLRALPPTGGETYIPFFARHIKFVLLGFIVSTCGMFLELAWRNIIAHDKSNATRLAHSKGTPGISPLVTLLLS